MGGKGETDLLVHLALVDAIHLVFNGIFTGHDVSGALLHLGQGTVKRGGLTTAGGTGDEKDAVRLADQRSESP